MVDYRRLIYPRPPSPILWRGCNTSGRSLPHAPPTGCLTIIKNSIPRPMLVIPFMTKNGINEPFPKTHRLLGYCLRTHLGGPFYMWLALVWNTPTGIGSGQSKTCGRTSAIAFRRQPINARRPIVANNSLTSVPPTKARRPSIVNGFSTRRLHVFSAFSTRRLLIALWPNVLLLLDRWRQPELSSCGFATANSTSGSPARLHGNSNARPLSHVCNTSRTAAHARRSRRSSNDRQLQRKQWLWPTRPTNNVATRWPHGLRSPRQSRRPLLHVCNTNWTAACAPHSLRNSDDRRHPREQRHWQSWRRVL
jgi:hypothetical protein